MTVAGAQRGGGGDDKRGFPMPKRMARLALLLTAVGIGCGLAAFPRATGAAPTSRGSQPDVQLPGVTLRAYESPYYNIFTDVPDDDAREAVIRMTKMYEEY